MTHLKCSATNCMHNCDCYCCKQEILVAGSEAKEKDHTCCSSFDLRSGDSARNHFETPEQALSVGCEAIHCVYNEARICRAPRIHINGPSALQAQATECATFKMR